MEAAAVRGGALSRRELLRVSAPALALAAAGGARVARAVSAAEPERRVGLREIHLEAREVTWELAPGKRIKAMAYNGRIPGPELRLKEGERARIVLKNGLAEPTTIHWHGGMSRTRWTGCRGSRRSRCSPGRPSSTSSRPPRLAPAGTTPTSRSAGSSTWVSTPL